jgi:hypothetical protein
MDNDIIDDMNREEGVGGALDVDDDQRAEEARREIQEDSDADARTGSLPDEGDF